MGCGPGAAPHPALISAVTPSRLVILLSGLLALVILAAAGVIWFLRPGPAATAKTPVTVADQIRAVFAAQAAAYRDKNEAGWLAPVDETILIRYRATFQNLQKLGVSEVEFVPDLAAVDATAAPLTFDVDLAYCPAKRTCPAVAGRPVVHYRMEMVPGDNGLRVSKVVEKDGRFDTQPVPWDRVPLAFATGDRVVLAGSPGEAAHVKQILPRVEKAARTADRYAALLGSEPERYRVYVADDTNWQTWFHMWPEDDAAAYRVPLGRAGTEVVISGDNAINPENDLDTLLARQLGSVVLHDGVEVPDGHDWLELGLVRHMGNGGRPAERSLNTFTEVYTLFRGRKAPKTLAMKPPADDDAEGRRRFEAYGHFGVDCLVKKYGEKETFAFARQVLREAKPVDRAAQAALGKPFATVDKACVSRIRTMVG